MTSFLKNGFEIIDDFISAHWLQAILDEIERSDSMQNNTGVRHIHKKLPVIADYLGSREFQEKSHRILPTNAVLVRAILFNKTAESNWYVTWHQDKTVAVSQQFEAPGWRGIESARKQSGVAAFLALQRAPIRNIRICGLLLSISFTLFCSQAARLSA